MMETEYSSTLPMIDIGRFASGDERDRSSIAAEMRAACRDVGFFYIVNHGVSAAVIDRAFDQSKRFFAQSREAKMRIHIAKSKIYRGYSVLGAEVTRGLMDWKETVDLGVDLPADHPAVIAGRSLHGPNPWPPDLPGWQEAMTDYQNALSKVGEAVMRAIAMSLGLRSVFFDDLFGGDPFLIMRLLCYPQQPAGDDKRVGIGIGEHTDFGCLTILAQDDVGGLEVQRRSGKWVTAPPIDGAFVVNIGDMIQIWTNRFYKSTPHRVVNNDSRARYSIPFCYEPPFEARVAPIDEFAAAAEVSAEIPVLYGEYLRQKYAQSFPQMLNQDDSLPNDTAPA